MYIKKNLQAMLIFGFQNISTYVTCVKINEHLQYYLNLEELLSHLLF